MVLKRSIIPALLVLLTSRAAHSFDLDEAKRTVVRAARDIKENVVPTVQALVEGNFEQVRSYLSQSDNPLVPTQAMEFVQNNIGPAQATVLRLIDQTPPLPEHVINALNGFRSGLGTQLSGALRLIKSHATIIKTVNIQNLLTRLATLRVRNAAEFITDLQADYSIAQLDLEPLKESALRLKSTVGVLEDAVKNLIRGDFVSLLNNLISTVQDFVQVKGSRLLSEEERQEKLDDLSNALLAVTRKLSGSIREAKPFIDALIPFSREVVTFTIELYKHFGKALWKQLPAQLRTRAQEAYNLLKTNEDKIKDAMNTIKAEVIKLQLF